MEQLYFILEGCCPAVDFRSEKALITEKVIDSIDLVSIIAEIEERYDISIESDMIDAEHFDSAEKMCELIQSLKG